LGDADKYYHDNEVEIAKDEMKHADYFIKKARELAITKEQIATVKECMARHDLMGQWMG
jgi:hypothetical protein